MKPITDEDTADKPINLKKVDTSDQKADLFTKELDKVKFQQLAKLIGMRSKLTIQATMVAVSKFMTPPGESLSESKMVFEIAD